ncbi:MAG: hypothetical protein IJR99_09930 [Kiritimatiellae bacterium]|nr:hypothetical protein [Kiritimatiellia bacterium]
MMKKLLVSVVVFAFFNACALDAARIDKIATWLPEKPAATGVRIGDRAAWDRLAALPSAAVHIKDAEKALAEPIPDVPDELYLEFSRNGNRTNYQKPYFMRVETLSNLLLGECLENKGRFLPGIIARVKAIAAERSWTIPAHDGGLTCFNGTPHIDLGSSRRTITFAFVYDWLRDVLPQDVKDLIMTECDRRTFQPYLATCRKKLDRMSPVARRHRWYEGRNNWNSVCNSCVVRAALAMIDDRRLRAEFVASAEHTVPFAMKGYTDDGYCSEGMGYWNYGYGHHLSLGLAVRAATGGKVNLFSAPKNRAVMLYPYGYQLTDWKSPHFADGGGNPNAPLLALQRQVFPDIVCRRAATQDLLAGGLTVISLRAFGQDPGPEYTGGFDTLPIRTWFPDAQVLISRVIQPRHKGALRLSIAIKGGHNAELHNHNDVGSYAIMLDGADMGGDPGGEVYTRRTFSKDRYVSKVLNSYGHPVPVVGGQLQKGGRAAAAKVLRTAFSDEKDVIELDCTAAYDVPALKSLVRTMIFDRVNYAVTITDRAAFSELTAFEVPVITYRTWEANDNFSEFTFHKSPTTHRCLKMAVQPSAPLAFKDEKIENPGKADVTRLAFAFEQPVTNATFTLVYSTH